MLMSQLKEYICAFFDYVIIKKFEKMSNSKREHEEETLFAVSATYNCAVHQFCIPCFYKIFPTGQVTPSLVTLPPNIRPELCPRSSSDVQSLSLFSSKARILTVGDGDLSFSRSLAQQGYAGKLTATTHESLSSLQRTYPNADEILSNLRDQGVTLFHEVDATNFEAHSFLSNLSFDIVIWNFPCIRVEKGADGQVSELEQNRNLLRAFFRSVQSILRKGGEVHIAHKTIEPFSWWGLCDIAREESFHLYRKIVFDRCNYPGYINRKVLDKKSFPCHDARLYIFTLESSDTHKSKFSKKLQLVNLEESTYVLELATSASRLGRKESKTDRSSNKRKFEAYVPEKEEATHAMPSQSKMNKKMKFDA